MQYLFALSHGPDGNTNRVIPRLYERLFGRMGRSTSYATEVPRRLLATVPGRGHPDMTEVTS